ncbi:IDEAL domain-containing protein [Halobacillus litoralis]|uniref:IDEAL domain-containing protein n=1 Tax=Halobacillus litoralis TaxID=45668 RepID=A0A845DLX0_9BACI|nr:MULTISPECIES: IDEAL domain-containing protein [Halobacillus]MYL18353.1 IDEAL domain-containing protein [Halobacillus litoralis]MYL30640.1 IDEAL domain-containing protein [Halobacillus halophilus]MYL38657.1 IDEAL domain-containing protein [Halobacillus litoralis]
MRKQKINYVIRRNPGYKGKEITAKRELSFGIQLASRLLLDHLSYQFNKDRLDREINHAIDSGDREAFDRLSLQYQPFTWE